VPVDYLQMSYVCMHYLAVTAILMVSQYLGLYTRITGESLCSCLCVLTRMVMCTFRLSSV